MTTCERIIQVNRKRFSPPTLYYYLSQLLYSLNLIQMIESTSIGTYPTCSTTATEPEQNI